MKMRRLAIALAILVSISSGLRAFGYQGNQSRDEKPGKDLRVAPGKLLAQGINDTPFGSRKLLKYTLEEVPLSEPIEFQLGGRKETIGSVFRLTITGGKSLAGVRMIWLDDAALTGVWSHGASKIGAIISDRSILRDGAEISVSNEDGSQLETLPERLKLPDSFKTLIKPAVEEGNSIVAIRSTLRIVGSIRERMIEIRMRTDRTFPTRNSALQLQIGKQFFFNELGGDTTGRALTLSLSPRVFATLKDGAEVIAFYNSPNRSGAFASDIWYFGRLNKSMLDK
jgi:hypothetical protein